MKNVKFDKYASVKNKFFWTALYFVCFMIGQNVPIPHLYGTFSASGTNANLLNVANIATAGNFFSPSVFSLGLGPWMGAAIIWRFLLIDKILQKKKISEKVSNYARAVFMIVLAVSQALSLMSNYQIKPLDVGPFSGQMNAQIMIVIVMVAGAKLIVWLANRNEERGFGGMTMFILYQIIISNMRNFSSLSGVKLDATNRMIFTYIGVTCLIVFIVSMIIGNAELRLHVNKIGIDSGYTGMSYLPIKLNPAGASPIMYGLMLLAIPQYIMHAIALIVPSLSDSANKFFAQWNLSSRIGLTIYLVLLFGLTIFFGLFTIRPREIAKAMKNSGDYLDSVQPGAPTRRYLSRRVVVLSVISAVFLVVFTGFPLYFMEIDPNLAFLFMLPGSLMMFVSMMMVLREEIADLLIGTKYSAIFAKK